jgi:hypothetical protein
MFRQARRAVLVMSLAAMLGGAALSTSATPALGYGKATWQTALNGTFNFPGTGFSLGFWGWCDFAGGVTSGNDADCQIAEIMHAPAGSGWTCELSIDATSWNQSAESFPPFFVTFHVTGSATVHPPNLTADEKAACVSFFTGGDGSTTFAGVDTFIPAAAGHYSIDPGSVVPGSIGEFHFTVTQVPSH